MKHRFFPPFVLVLAVSSLAGCSALSRLTPQRAAPAATVAPVETGAVSVEQGRVIGASRVTAAQLDQTSAEDKKAALAAAPASGETSLGSLVVSLGSPVEQGFWLRSPLVSAASKGRVETAGGKSVAVDLLPGASGAQLSLAAYRALGLALTDLPKVTVFAQ